MSTTNLKLITANLTLAVGLSSCALERPEIIDVAAMRQEVQTEPPRETAPMPLSTRMSFPSETHRVIPESADESLFAYRADGLPLDQALKLFAAAYSLNVIVGDDVTGTISIDLQDVSFEEAMSALLDSHGYYWLREGNLIHVRSWETRLFELDYIRLIRTGSGNSQAQVSSTSSSGSEAGSSDTAAGTMSIQQNDTVSFWDELEEQLATLVSDDGRLVVNRLAGTIQISDQHQRVEEIAAYLQQIEQSIYRQVDIDIRIVEVTLGDDMSLGVDWSRLVSQGTDGDNVDYLISNTITSPAGGVGALPASILLTLSDTGPNGRNNLTGVLSALSEQGDVQVVSQPHIRTLNNQSALIKVGTDRTFFRKEQVANATTAGSLTFSTDVPQVVTEGIVLSITPQISMDGWITMDVSPVVTRVSSVSEVIDDNGNVQSTAPNLDISQASSLVRARSGQTIVIGGLIQTQDSYTSRGIPGLKNIPGIGYLFSGTYRAEQKKELIMFLTPRLVDSNPLTMARPNR